jgi:hypothetical protein
MFLKESKLGKIGSILGAVGALLTLIFRVIIGAGAAVVTANLGSELVEEFGEDLGQQYFDGYANAVASTVATSMIVTGIIAILMVVAGVVLGFIGTGKLAKGDKQGSILLIVSGGLAVISIFMGGWVAFAFITAMAALNLAGGIMAVCKKTPAAPMAPPAPPTTPAV